MLEPIRQEPASPATRPIRFATGHALGRVAVALALVAAMLGAIAPAAGAGADRPIGTALRQERLRDALKRHVLKGLDGETLKLGELQGDVVVINFWATWCRPCRRELPSLDSLDRELKKKGGRVVAVSIDLDKNNVRRFVREHQIELAVYHDGPQQLARWIDLDRIPYTVVLDRAGEIAFTTSDLEQDWLSNLGAVTKKLLAAKPPAAAAAAEGGTR